MHFFRYLLLVFFLSACSTSDFFLGKDNHPPAKPLPQVINSVSTKILWQNSTGNSGAEQGLALKPAFLNQQIFTVSANGELKGFRRDTGKVFFSQDLHNDISAGVAAVADRVFVGTKNGSLLAINFNDGKTIWRESLPSMMITAPVVVDSLVLARSIDGTLSAFNWQTGELRWRYHSTEPALSIQGNARPVAWEGVIILTTDNGYFVVLNAQTGLPILEKRITAGIGSDPVSRLVDMDTTPKINHGILYGAAYQSMVFAIDLQAGQPLWRQPNVSTPREIALDNQAVYIVNDVDHVIGINAQTGDVLWENSELEGRYLSPPFALPNGLLGVLDREGYLHWLNGRTGNLIGQNKLAPDGATTAAEISSDGRIFWQLNNGKIISFRPEQI